MLALERFLLVPTNNRVESSVVAMAVVAMAIMMLHVTMFLGAWAGLVSNPHEETKCTNFCNESGLRL